MGSAEAVATGDGLMRVTEVGWPAEKAKGGTEHYQCRDLAGMEA